MSTLMDRIKTTDFLSQPIPTQLNLILSLQAMRIEGLKNAKLPKKRKISAKGNKIKTRTKISSQQKALKALAKLSPAQFALIQKQLNKGK